MADAERARQWLAECGVRETDPGTWRHDDEPDRTLTKNDVALECSSWIFEDADLDEDARNCVALGLMDLLDESWTAIELHMHYCTGKGRPVPRSLWDGLRARLDAAHVAECVTYHLWCEWFECRETSELAFRSLLGDDFATGRTAVDDDAFLRRATCVLEHSGPVAWSVKQPAYDGAVAIDRLRPAVFRGILASYHDFFGKLEPGPAFALLVVAIITELVALNRSTKVDIEWLVAHSDQWMSWDPITEPPTRARPPWPKTTADGARVRGTSLHCGTMVALGDVAPGQWPT